MCNIVIIDNDESNQDRYNMLFRPYNTRYPIIEFNEFDYGKVLEESAIVKAVAEIEAASPLLVLLCVNVNEISKGWYAVLDGLKTSKSIKDVPVIMMMPIENKHEDEELCFKLGAEDYIPAPCSDGVLSARVRARVVAYTKYLGARSDSLTDILTGCRNRRFFDASLTTLWSNAQLKQQSISALMIDIDKFKSFNDRYGHQHADIVLQEVAKTLQGAFVRNNDVVARWGGEEFAVLLPDTNASTAHDMAEKARLAVENLAIPCNTTAGSKDTHVTVSIGIHTMTPPQDENIDEKTGKNL